MYKLTQLQRKTQAERLKNVDLRLVVGYLKTYIRWLSEYPDGPLPYLVEGHRSGATQAKYYAQGRTTPGPIITHSRPGTSLHELSPARAIDVGFLDSRGNLVQHVELLREFNQFWQEHSVYVTWGGNWRTLVDAPHFEVDAAA